MSDDLSLGCGRGVTHSARLDSCFLSDPPLAGSCFAGPAYRSCSLPERGGKLRWAWQSRIRGEEARQSVDKSPPAPRTPRCRLPTELLGSATCLREQRRAKPSQSRRKTEVEWNMRRVVQVALLALVGCGGDDPGARVLSESEALALFSGICPRICLWEYEADPLPF